MNPRVATFARKPALALACVAALGGAAHAQPLDRFDEKEDRGLFRRSHQKALDLGLVAGMTGLAFWEGTDTRLGRASWQAIDATLASALTTEAMKDIFRRPRPIQDTNPNHWFRGGGHKSFPSGEVALVTSVVTPYLYAYREDTPAAYALAVLPVYMGAARMKSQAHWLSDVLVGGGVGYASARLAMRRDVPLTLSVTGRSAWVGWRTRF